jgi:5-methylcytosine-specific restriction protein A
VASGWKGSTRRQSLGKEYFRNRAAVMKRDAGICQIRIPGLCIGTATDCDHIGDRLNHSPENMRAACAPCHGRRSGQQGGRAAGKERRVRAAARFRQPERHPGEL